MLPNNKVDLWDEGLRLLFLESGKEANFPAPNVVAAATDVSDTDIAMSEAKQQTLIHQLAAVMNTQSLGQLLTEALVHTHDNTAVSALKAALPESVISDLKVDAVYPNNIPIVLLKNLLSALNISFQNAEKSIRKTFDMLRNQAVLGSYGALNPAYKKKSSQHYSFRDNQSQSLSKGSGKELFQNEDALNRYLNRLEVLMS